METNMTTLNKQTCSCCGQSINKRQIGLFQGMVVSLWGVYCWCIDHNKHEFQRKEIKHLFKDENVSARFGDWVFFGGLVYKEGKGHYGLNMERCAEFFKNRLPIATMVTKDPRTGEIEKYDPRTIRQIPSLVEFLDSDNRFIVLYGEPTQAKLI